MRKLIFSSIVLVFLSQLSFAVQVDAGQGLQFSQVDLLFTYAMQYDSSYGLAAVDIPQICSSTGMTSGYLNIATSQGWVVQNMPIDSASQLPGLSTMFDLGSGGDVSSLSVYADFSAAPVTSFSGVPSTSFSVSATSYNAEGRGDSLTTLPISSVDLSVLSWSPGGTTVANYQPGHPSIEQDKGQCGPAAVANSLQWLEDKKGIVVPNEHESGIRNDTLVGKLDQTMLRAKGYGVDDRPFINGKLQYISDAKLDDDLIVKHWSTNRAGFNGNITRAGLTSYEKSGEGGTLMEWIIKEIEHGEDVELAIGWDDGKGHWVDLTGAGTTLGIPWISWVQDAYQGEKSVGTNWYDGGIGFSYVVDNKIICFIEGQYLTATIDLAVSESVPEPATLGLLALGGLCLLRRRQKQ